MQKLVMPFTNTMILCGYKVNKYKEVHGYPHYGVDLWSCKRGFGQVYSSGEGIVLASGHDNTLGYGIAILYKEVYDHVSRKFVDIVARYMHLKEVFVSTGDTVSEGTLLATEGKEGTGDYHLHLEFDIDTNKNYACWSPQVSRGHTFWVKGSDTTVDPFNFLTLAPWNVLTKSNYSTEWRNTQDETRPNKFKVRPLAWDEEKYKCYYAKPAFMTCEKDEDDIICTAYDIFARKVPTETAPNAGEYAKEKDIKNFVPFDTSFEFESPTDLDGYGSVIEFNAEVEKSIKPNTDKDKYRLALEDIRRILHVVLD